MTEAPSVATTSPSRHYVLAILTLVYAFNHVDRQILLILIEPIKDHLHLEDWHVGALTGIAFASVFATLGLPVAAWADRGVRRNIVALALAVWSVMTALSGLAQNFWHLLFARMGVGVGEAGATPPAASMISDLYPPRQRATALGVYTTGIGLGILAGFPLGGLIYEAWGWRVAFFVAGVPGLLLALLVLFTVKEPPRGAAEGTKVDALAKPTIVQTFRFLLSQPSFLWLLLGCMFICVASNAFLAWTSSFLQRNYGVGVGQVSVPLGLLVGGLGGLGAIGLGFVCDRLSARDLRWRPLMIAICAAITLPFGWLFLQAPTLTAALALNAAPAFVGLLYASLAYTASQELAPPTMRATSSAFTLFCLTLLGIGGGPTLSGALSSMFKAQGQSGAASLQHALELMLLFHAAAIPCLLMATSKYRRDVDRARQRVGR